MPVAIRAILEDEPDMAASWDSPDDAVAALQALPDDMEVILSDEPMLVFAANREVPPWFVDTSRVRISAGWLSRGQLTQYILRERPGAILFWSGRFGRIPGFREWVGRYYRLAETFARDQELYVRADS